MLIMTDHITLIKAKGHKECKIVADPHSINSLIVKKLT